ncbi:hypothetical protein, partial [Deinococcus sp.]|uniref:hypothetical protein n=1 Tax=Deinococcus sp. TaxID=47478 RepID=UPI0025FE3252
RREVMQRNGWSLRELYRTLDTPGKNPLRSAQDVLDTAVRAAYGMGSGDEVLSFLLALNLQLSAREGRGEAIVGPGLPANIPDPDSFLSADAVQPLKFG